MEIRQQFFTENDCYKAQRYIKPIGIMVHSTGANNPYLRRYLEGDDLIGYNPNGNHWNTPNLEVCVHGFIGLDKSGNVQTYQTLPWDMRAWHAGGKANNTHISFEICEDDLSDFDYFWKAYSATVGLCAYLCKEYGITPEDIICHSEGNERGIASNHADVMHWFPRFGASMDTLRADVAKELEDIMTGEEIYKALTEYLETLPTSDYAIASSAKGVAAGIFKDGDNDGLVDKPRAITTREDLSVVMNRLGLFDK